MRDEIIEPDKVIERIGPKRRSQIRTAQHSSEGVANGLVRPFGRTVLVRGVRTRQLNSVPELLKHLADVVAAPEFTTAIHPDILVRARGRVVGKPIVEPIDWRGFGSESATSNATTEMVSDQTITALAVKADKGIATLAILTGLDDETKVNAQALVAESCDHGIGVSGGGFAQLGCKAHRAVVDFRGERECRHTTDMLMHLGKATKVKVPQALVPKHPKSRARQRANGEVGGRDREEW